MKTDTTDNRAVGDPAATVAPQIVSQIEDAPARGILPNISFDLAANPNCSTLDAQPMEKINDLLFRRYLRRADLTFVEWTAKKGAVVPLTHHVNAQAACITDGLAEVYLQGRNYLMKSGDTLIVPPNGPHEFVFLEDTIDVDIFCAWGARLARRNGDLFV
jgi:quercetin dioxygenase-like cupin family protein